MQLAEQTSKRVHIVVPDEGEYNRSFRMCGPAPLLLLVDYMLLHRLCLPMQTSCEIARHVCMRQAWDAGAWHVARVEGRPCSDEAAIGPGVTGRRLRRFRGALQLTDGLSMGYLKESRRGVLDFMGLFRAADAEGTIPPAEAAARADIFLAVNASSVELVDVERYCREYVGVRPLVLWNIELDTLRSDLGAPRGGAHED